MTAQHEVAGQVYGNPQDIKEEILVQQIADLRSALASLRRPAVTADQQSVTRKANAEADPNLYSKYWSDQSGVGAPARYTEQRADLVDQVLSLGVGAIERGQQVVVDFRLVNHVPSVGGDLHIRAAVVSGRRTDDEAGDDDVAGQHGEDDAPLVKVRFFDEREDRAQSGFGVIGEQVPVNSQPSHETSPSVGAPSGAGVGTPTVGAEGGGASHSPDGAPPTPLR